MCTNLHFIDNW